MWSLLVSLGIGRFGMDVFGVSLVGVVSWRSFESLLRSHYTYIYIYIYCFSSVLRQGLAELLGCFDSLFYLSKGKRSESTTFSEKNNSMLF